MASRLAILPIGLFLAWGAVSQRWYVCHIKQACGDTELVMLDATAPEAEKADAAADTASEAVSEALPAAEAPLEARAELGSGAEALSAESEASAVDTAPAPVMPRGATILFPSGAASVSGDSTLVDELQHVAGRLQGQRSSITIVGHTDDRGAIEFNQALGLRRATDVRDALVRRGIEASRMHVSSAGEDRPVGDNTTDEGRRQNRRVEIQWSADATSSEPRDR